MAPRQSYEVYVEGPEPRVATAAGFAEPQASALNLNAAGGCWPEPHSIYSVGKLSAEGVMARGPFDSFVTHGGEYAAGNIASRAHCRGSDLYARSSGTSALEKMWELAALWVEQQNDQRVRGGTDAGPISLLTSDEEYPASVTTFGINFQRRLRHVPIDVHLLATESWRTDERLVDLERGVEEWARRLRPDSLGIVLLSHVQFRTGVLLPLPRLFRRIRSALGDRVLLLADCAQSFGHVPLSLEELGADVAIFCPHKWIHAPTTGYVAVLSQSLRRLARDLGEFDESRDRGVGVAGTQNRTKFRQVAHAVDLFWDSRGFARIRELSAAIDAIGRGVRGLHVISPMHRLASASAILSVEFPGLAAPDYYDLQREVVERFNIVAGVVEGKSAWEDSSQAVFERAALRFSADYRLQAEHVTRVKAALEWARDQALSYVSH